MGSPGQFNVKDGGRESARLAAIGGGTAMLKEIAVLGFDEAGIKSGQEDEGEAQTSPFFLLDLGSQCSSRRHGR